MPTYLPSIAEINKLTSDLRDLRARIADLEFDNHVLNGQIGIRDDDIVELKRERDEANAVVERLKETCISRFHARQDLRRPSRGWYVGDKKNLCLHLYSDGKWRDSVVAECDATAWWPTESEAKAAARAAAEGGS